MADMSAEAVARRLQQLNALYVPETVEEGRLRLDAERPRRQEDFNQAVARRLNELRALCELTRALRGKAKTAARLGHTTSCGRQRHRSSGACSGS